MRKEGTLSMRKKRYIYFITLIIGLLFTACSRSEKTDMNTQRPSYDWQTKGFVVGNTSAAGNMSNTSATSAEPVLFVTDFVTGEYDKLENTPTSRVSYMANGDGMVVFDTFYTVSDTEWHPYYAVQKVDAEGNVQASAPISPNTWGHADGRIEGMDVLDEEHYVFWVATDIQEDERGYQYAGHFYAIYTDADGKEQRRTDLIDFLKEQDIWKGYGGDISYSGKEIRCDSQGNIYLYDWKKRAMYLLNPEGGLLTSYAYQAGKDNFIYSLRTDGGEVILICESDRGMEFIWMDPESRQANRLAVAEDLRNITKWYGLWGDTLYYATRERVMGWNVSTGEQQIMVNMAENEIRDVDKTFFLKTASGGRLLVTEDSRRYLLTFSAERPEIQGGIQVVNLVQQDDLLKGRVVAFARENPLYGIEYVAAYEGANEGVNADRVLMEMANGKGPAIAFLSREDMENLGSKGALADLNEILWEENLNALLPGVIELGTCNGGLYGLPFAIDSLDTVCIGSNYFQGDTWTIGDVLTVLEEHPELEGLFANMQINYDQNLAVLLSKDLEHSPFIENGKARFDSKEFQELLATVKARGNAEEIITESVNEKYSLIREGKILGVRDMLFNMQDFCSRKNMQGDDAYYVGFPTETGKGTYLVAEKGVLVVNQNAAEKEEIEQLLNYLFGLESQQMVRKQISVRLDVPETLVMYREDLGQYVVRYYDGNFEQYKLRSYDESYLEEYLSLLKSAVPRPIGSRIIYAIIWEEAEPYFYSDKSVETVCDAIQRRVQLYLDERN